MNTFHINDDKMIEKFIAECSFYHEDVQLDDMDSNSPFQKDEINKEPKKCYKSGDYISRLFEN